MSHTVARREDDSLLTFFLFTFAITWLCFGAAALIAQRAESDLAFAVFAAPLFLIGAVTPSIVATVLTARREGGAAVRALIDRVFIWRVHIRWYVFAAFYIVTIKLVVALLYRIITGAWPAFGPQAWYVMAAALLISTWVQAGEEIGWRGFALPRLMQRMGLPRASIVLGVIWACWHLPLFFIPDTTTTGQSFPLYLLQVTALSVTMAWLWWRTGGSLLLVMLLHAAVNNTKDIVPSAEPGATNAFALSGSLVAWLTVALLWIAAAYFLLRMRSATMPGTPASGRRYTTP